MRALALAAALALSLPSTASEPPRRITLELHKADIHNVLRVLAETGRVNIVVGEEVKGQVTLRLRNVTWADAFEVVLASRGLGAERRGNIIRVAPLAQLAGEAEARARLKQQRTLAAPLVTRIIPVNYARAADLLPHVKAMLSPRGTAAVDERTNVIIVRDVELPGA